MNFTYDDGGRKAAGYRGSAGDCVVRSICIASRLPYQIVYDELLHRGMDFGKGRSRAAKRVAKCYIPSRGVYKGVYDPFLAALGWRWVPTMRIGQGCKVHLRADEVPAGRLIVNVSKHLVAVIDGVIHDTHDCSRDGTRCVYGYYERTRR